MNCDICDKTFTGLVCFQQHEASEKHKRKVQLSQMRATNATPIQNQGISSSNDLQIMHCSVCKINLMGMLNYEKHVNSMQHADMVTKRNSKNSVAEDESAKESTVPSACMPVNFSVATLEPFAKCVACQKEFSGPEPYQQHIASDKHKKKAFQSNLLNQKLNLDTVDDDKIMPFFKMEGEVSKNGNMPGNVEPFAECSYCNMQFSSPESYLLHVDSEDHLRKVFNSSDESLKSLKNENKVIQEVQVSKGGNQLKTVKPYAECTYCNMEFSGPAPYQLHVDSAAHMRKVSSSLNSTIQSSESPKSTQGQLRCDVCDKDFSGPIPYGDHMRSIVHKKKVQNVEFLQKISTGDQVDSTTPGPSYLAQCQGHTQSPVRNQMWYCEVCEKQSTGPIPHEAHLLSEAHVKKTRAAEMERNLKAKVEFLMQHQIENANELKKEKVDDLSKGNQVNSNLANKSRNDKTNESSKNFYISNDLILCDALEKIGIIPVDDLNVTVFYPEDEIIFA